MNLLPRLSRLLARFTAPSRPDSGGGWRAPSRAGIYVDEHVALQYAAVWACCRVIAEAVSAMPWHVMGKQGGRRERIDGHPADWLLHIAPNGELDAYNWRQTMLLWALTWGNGYSEIERDGSLRPIALWPLEPDRVTPTRDERGRLVYRISNASGGSAELPARDVFHLRGPGWNGLTGYSPIDLARNSIGLGLATERFGAAFFGNGATPGAVLEAPETLALSPEGKALLLEEFNAAHRGPDNYGKVAYLDGGMKYKPITIPPEAAQFLETRQHQVLEICRWYKVPPHKVYELTRATYNNVEQQQIEFLTETLIPWITRLEQEADAKLLGPYQRGRLYTKIKPESLLRGDVKTRYEAYAIGRQWGWFSINDIRALEDLDPIPQGGDEYLTPLNMREAGSELQPEPEPAPAAEPRPALAEELADRLRVLIAPPESPPLSLAVSCNPHITLPAHQFSFDNRQVHEAPPQSIHVAAPTVNVALPELTLPAAVFHLPPPEIRVETPVHVAAPEVRIEAPITVEAAAAPEIRVETPVHVAAPEVRVEAPITVEAAAPPTTEVIIQQAAAAPPLVDVHPHIHVQAAPAPDIVLQVGEQIHERDPESLSD